MAGLNEGVQYLKSVPSVLKILEIVCILISALASDVPMKR